MRGYLTVIMEGKYTDAYLKKLGTNAPKFTAEEMKIISGPIDFLGLNIYRPEFVRAADSTPWAMRWCRTRHRIRICIRRGLPSAPRAMYWLLHGWRPKRGA